MWLWFAAEDELDEAVEDEADPAVDEQAPVEAIGLVARGWRQVRHEDEEVEQAAEEDCGELFEEAGEHGVSCQSPASTFSTPSSL